MKIYRQTSMYVVLLQSCNKKYDTPMQKRVLTKDNDADDNELFAHY